MLVAPRDRISATRRSSRTNGVGKYLGEKRRERGRSMNETLLRQQQRLFHEVLICYAGAEIQGDHSGCAKPPVDIKTKLAF